MNEIGVRYNTRRFQRGSEPLPATVQAGAGDPRPG